MSDNPVPEYEATVHVHRDIHGEIWIRFDTALINLNAKFKESGPIVRATIRKWAEQAIADGRSCES